MPAELEQGESLSEQEMARAVQAATGLSLFVKGGTRLTGGRINETWRLETNRGQVVLRFYPPGRRQAQVEFEMGLLAHLADAGCAVPRPLRQIDGALVGVVGERLFCFQEFLPARAVSGGASPQELAALLLPVFEALKDAPTQFRPIRETRVFEKAHHELETALRADEERHRAVRASFESLKAWEKDTALPGSVIHADIHPDNILRDELGKLWLIDFDDAHVGTRALDWVLAALEFSWQGETFHRQRFDELLRALTPPWATAAERSAAPQLLKLLALKFAAFECTLDTSTDKNRYLELLLRL